MTVSEHELEQYRKMLETMTPQMQAMTQMWEPLRQILQEMMGKIGITVKVNKMIYLRNKGTLIYGIIFEGPQDILDEIAVRMSGKALNIKQAEEINIGEEK